MRLVTDEVVEDLIRLNRLRGADTRLTRYSQEQAKETADALKELLTHRRGVPVEGVAREEKVETV